METENPTSCEIANYRIIATYQIARRQVHSIRSKVGSPSIMHLIAFVFLYFLGRIRDYFVEWINSIGLSINILNGSDPGADSDGDSSSGGLNPAPGYRRDARFVDSTIQFDDSDSGYEADCDRKRGEESSY